jgi:hypothetical protein
LHGPATALRRKTLPSLGWGFLALLLTPFAAIGCLFTVVGIPVGIVIGIGYVLALYASQLVLALAVGRGVAPQRWRVGTGFRAAWGTLLCGLALVVLARSLPVPGWTIFSSIIVAMLALGALFIHWFRRGTLPDTPERAAT